MRVFGAVLVAVLFLTLSSGPARAQDGAVSNVLCGQKDAVIKTLLWDGYVPTIKGNLKSGVAIWLFVNHRRDTFFMVYFSGDEGCLVDKGEALRGFEQKEG